jgi:hypothetical protein
MRFFDYIAIGMVVVALVMALSLRSFLFSADHLLRNR